MSSHDDGTSATGPQGTKLAYVILYVKDIEESVERYSKLFGLKIRRFDESRRWAELETGETTLAFTPIVQHETELSGGVHVPMLKEGKQNVEIACSVFDIHAVFEEALKMGATPIAYPERKDWGQMVGYVRDKDGITVRIGSHIAGC